MLDKRIYFYRTVLFVLICGGLGLSENKAFAADRHVGVSATYTTINLAVTAAVTGVDRVVFDDTTFTSGVIANIAKKLAFTSIVTTTPSTVNLGGANKFNFVAGSTDSSFSYLTIKGATNSAVATAAGLNLAVGNTTFDSNTSGGNGGAIANLGNLTVSAGSKFTNNIAKFGGAIHNSGTGQLTVGAATFKNNMIEAAAGHSQMGGGAIYNTGTGALFSINGATFEENEATPTIAANYGNGGAVCNLNSTANNTITNSTFTSNKANATGGAIYNGGTLTVSNSGFKTNSADANGGGGAIYNAGSLTLGTGNTFTENDAKAGGAVSSAGTLLDVTSNTFTKNTTAGSGGAILASATSNLIKNSTFTENTASSGGAISSSKDITISGSTFKNNSATGNGGVIAYSTGTMYLNPGNLFENNTANGMGVISHSSGDVYIDNNTFQYNKATNGTGAIGVGVSGSVNIKNTTFKENIANGNAAGAININKGVLNLQAGNVFTGNEVKVASGYGGGAVFNGAGTLTVDDNKFTGNISAGNSGAIQSQGGVSTIGNSAFKNNVAGSSGGAIFNNVSGSTLPTMTLNSGNTFEGNTAKIAGGALANVGTLDIKTGNSFTNNKITTVNTGTNTRISSGGAIYNSGANAKLTVDSATFTGNSIKNSGGADSGVEINSNTAVQGGTITNTISNLANTISNSTITTSSATIENINYYLGVLGTDYNLSGGDIILNIASGGAVYNTGTLNLNAVNISNSTLSANNIAVLSDGIYTTAYGGAIYNSGTLNINGNSLIKGSKLTTTGVANLVAAEGGAIYNNGTLNLNSTVGNIVFGGTGTDKNTVNGIENDIYNAKDKVINIDGSANDVVINNGIKSGVYNADPDLDKLGNAAINKTGAGRLLINGDSSMYTGAFASTAGTTIVSFAGKMFGGGYTKNSVEDSLLKVTSADGFNYGVSLGDNGELEHYNSTLNQSVIGNTKLAFTGTGASATFGRDSSFGTSLINYALNNKIENGQANDVVFNNSDVKLGSTDYTGTTTYTVNNGHLNLSSNALKTYEFDDLKFNNSKLSFGVGIEYNTDGTPKYNLLSDKLQVNNATTDTIGIGVIKVFDDSEHGLGQDYHAANVLTGAGGLKFISGYTATIATTAYEYNATVDADLTGVILSAYKQSDEYSLNGMNILDGTRGFNFSYFATQPTTYNIGADLDDMTTGVFEVTGFGTTNSIISGALVDSTGTPTGGNGSFFKIVDDGTDFYMHDVTIQDAYSATSGSVLNMTNDNSTALIENVIVANNNSDVAGGAIYKDGSGSLLISNSTMSANTTLGDGGAIYNTGTNFVISNTTISGNTSTNGDGGAVYNSGILNLNSTLGDVVFSNNTDLSGSNDIFNNGTININGSANKVSIDGGFAGSGNINKSGAGELLLTSNSDSASYTGSFNQTEGITNVESGAKFFGGTSNISGGDLNWKSTGGKDANSNIVATGGNINIASGATLDLNNSNDFLKSGATINLANTSILNVSAGKAVIDNSDNWSGTINNSGTGTVELSGVSRTPTSTGTLNQTGGTLNLANSSIFELGGSNNITGGNLGIYSGSSLYLPATSSLSNINTLALNNGSVNALDGAAQTYSGNTLAVGPGSANFNIDINPTSGTYDKFQFTNITGPGTIMVSDYNLIGAPISKEITLRIFDSPNISPDVKFGATDKTFNTPIYKYKLSSLGGGYYSFGRGGFNPQAYRSQVATMAAANNQLTVNNAIFDHVYLDSEDLMLYNKNVNRYSTSGSQFAPYQYSTEDKSIWTKNYATFEHLSMSPNLNVENNAYGSIFGTDLDVIHLKNGWKLLPTAFVAYNGAHQTFNGVSMYQNGGQGGLMGTFMKGDFIGSILGYAGGYNNEMNLNGVQDTAGNWFAGGATKAAYNFHPTRNLILQPTVLASYNAFGDQNFFTNFGQVGVNSGMLNGFNVAPGFNVIYGRETWSLYGTAQYMYYINDEISGSMGGVKMPDVKMNHGFLEYGIGATKTWKERLMGYAQVAIRNGGRTGVGFQLGFSWRF